MMNQPKESFAEFLQRIHREDIANGRGRHNRHGCSICDEDSDVKPLLS